MRQAVKRTMMSMRHINDEKGAALIVALMMMVIMTLLGFAAILTSNVDVMISGNERTSIKAQYVAEAGLADAIRFLSVTSSVIPTDPQANAGWHTAPRTVTMPDGYSYSYTISFKQDVSNLDAPNPATPVVCYDQTFKYNSKAPKLNGFPVMVVTSSATGPNNNQAILEMELTKDYIPVEHQVKGAVTSNGNVDVKGGNGSISISGYNYDINGNTYAGYSTTAGGAVPGVDAQGTVSVQTASTVTGVGGVGSVVQNAPASNWLGSLGAAIGKPDPTECDAFLSSQAVHKFGPANIYPDGTTSMPTATDYTQYSGGVVYVQMNGGSSSPPYPPGSVYGAQINFDGILIVHNPRYVPAKWRVSVLDPAHPAYYNPADPNYDPKLDPGSGQHDSAYAAACMPSVFGNINGGTNIKGVVIADRIDKFDGNTSILGAVITLDSIVASNDELQGNATIKFSLAAIEKYASGQYVDKKLSWKKKASYQ